MLKNTFMVLKKRIEKLVGIKGQQKLGITFSDKI